jgi:tetratricopeptide (TPR) repeat protein
MPLAVENASKVALQGADMEAQAWSIQGLTDSRARQAMDGLIADSKQLTDPVDRARALGAVAIIISQHVQLPSDAAHAFLALSTDALKAVGDAKTRSDARDEWTVSMGQVFLNEATTHARAGHLAKALVAADQLGALHKDAVGASARARLHALHFQSHIAMGRTDTANQSLRAAVGAAGEVPDVVERAALLRKVARLLGSVTLAPIQDVATGLRKQMESKPTLNNQHAYAHLSLMYADFGARTQADENYQFAVKTKGMTPVESNALQADLITRGEMAAARLLHISGHYSESEAILQRISGYLL